jgi:hypothetical protein
MAIPAFKYQVSGQGFAVARPQSMLIPSGTVVDTSLAQWSALSGVAPPIDAIMLTQATYDYCTSSNGVIGLGYAPGRVAVGPGVVSTAPGMPDWYWQERYNDGSPVIKKAG